MKFIASKHWGNPGRGSPVSGRKDTKDPRPLRSGARDAREASEPADPDADEFPAEDFQPRWWPVLED